MAREIDVDNLDKDDVAYLRQRPWLVAEAEQIHGVEDMEERMAEVERKDAEEKQQVIESGSYDQLNVRELREVARDKHLDPTGLSKAQIVQQIKEEDERVQALEDAQKDDESE